MNDLQTKIDQARQAGISEDLIKKKVESLGGSYSPPQVQSSGSPALSALSGINSVNPVSKYENNPIMKFLASAPMRLGKGLGVLGSNLTNSISYTKDPETLALQQKAEEMAQQAEANGDLEGARKLREVAGSSKAVNEQIITNKNESYGTAGEDILKGGVGTGAMLLPGGSGLWGKAGMGVLQGAASGFGASEKGNELTSTIGGGVLGGGLSLAGSGLKWAGNKLIKDTLQATGKSQNLIIKKFGTTVQKLADKYGKSADEMLGPISERDNGGVFQTKLNEAEKIIQNTVDTAGTNVKIDGDIVINALKKELTLQKLGLDDDAVSALKEIIKTAQKRYKNGITAKQALIILRQANSKFGKAMGSTPKGSTAKVAQEIQAQAMRTALKDIFPELKDALQTQSEILTLKPIVSALRTKTLTNKGFDVKSIDLTRPGTYPIVGDLLNAVGGKVLPATLKAAGAIAESPITQRGLTNALVAPQNGTMTTETPVETPVEPQTTLSTPSETNAGLQTGNLPTPILSKGGKWAWDGTKWVPNKQTGTGTATTGAKQYQNIYQKSPEELYDAWQRASQAGDKESASMLRTLWEDESKYQDKMAKTKEKAGGGNVGKSLDMLEKLYAPKSNKTLSMGDKTTLLGGGPQARAKIEYKKLSDQEYVDRLQSYNRIKPLVAGAINKAAGAGVLNASEYPRLDEKAFPNEYTSDTVAKQWFEDARESLGEIMRNNPEAADIIESYLQENM